MVYHPVHFWSEADFNSLRAEVVAGNVKAVRGTGELEGLTLYTYTEQCQYGRKWNEWNRCARGLILDERDPTNIRVVALPFPKFFNYGEMSAIPNESFTVTDKLDGSLGIIFYWNSKWRVATKGSFTSEQARWAEAWLDARPRITGRLADCYTYLVEIIYPSNRIVVPYDYEALVLIGVYECQCGSGWEMSPDTLRWMARYTGLPLVSYSTHTLPELLELCRTLPASQEGFVVRFESGLRVKIKGDEYVRVHRLISRMTPLGVWDAMLNRDDLDVLRSKLPEEFHRDFDQLVSLLTQRLDGTINAIHYAYEDTRGLTNAELGKLLSGPHRMTEAGAKFVFAMRRYGGFQGFMDVFDVVGTNRLSLRGRIFDYIRPTGNVLEGYVPSTVMNRFSEES